MLIGARAESSAAAGLSYSGVRFTNNFDKFIEKYDTICMTDMYVSELKE